MANIALITSASLTVVAVVGLLIFGPATCSNRRNADGNSSSHASAAKLDKNAMIAKANMQIKNGTSGLALQTLQDNATADQFANDPDVKALVKTIRAEETASLGAKFADEEIREAMSPPVPHDLGRSDMLAQAIRHPKRS